MVIMRNFKKFISIISGLIILSACQTVAKKIDEKTIAEENKLTQWLQKSEEELKIKFGQPDKVEFLSSSKRNYIYISKKLNIKCERKFEINSNNVVVGFSSKNCF
tara:strand:+ start:808 stop:1122 length:315 start_codon:yes stop_codon:yes gene_type:complete